MIITQVHLTQVHTGAGDKKRPLKNVQFCHNATDVSSFEGAYNWHADYRNVHQSCCQRIEFSFLYDKPTTNVILENLAVHPTGLTTADQV